MEQAQGDSPVGHGACRILFREIGELLFRHFVLERVHEGNAALESPLGAGRAGNRKRNFAQLFIRIVMMRMHVVIQGNGGQNKQSTKQNGGKEFHAWHLFHSVKANALL